MNVLNLKDIAKTQKEFLKSPRENIIKLNKDLKDINKQLITKLSSEGRIEELKLFYDFHKEYFRLIRKLLKDNVISADNFKDDVFDLKNSQRIKEVKLALENYLEKKNKNQLDEATALTLSRNYSAQLEIIWGKFKRVIYLKYPKLPKKYLNLTDMQKILSKLEGEYSLSLTLIKSTLERLFRNKINHEETYFDPPDEIVFLDIIGKTREIKRLKLEKICELILKTMIINSAIDNIEKTLISSFLNVLLRLNDLELKEYCKTGILTKEMKTKIEENNS